MYDLAFPNLNIFIEKMNSFITIGNFTIAYYGIIIAIGMLLSFFVVLQIAKKKNINEDYFYDIFIIAIIFGIIGARIYYVLFNLDYYMKDPIKILDIRGGGLAVYGGIILTFIALFVYFKIKKLEAFKILDIAIIGLPLGQSIGRWGNFFNMEAFGTYTNNLFAMRLNKSKLDDSVIDMNQLLNIIKDGDAEYIQAHPTFLYESFFCLLLFVILIIAIMKFHRFNGEIVAMYLIGYGIIRFFIESLRTDSLMIGTFKISKIVAVVCFLVGIVLIIINIYKLAFLKNK